MPPCPFPQKQRQGQPFDFIDHAHSHLDPMDGLVCQVKGKEAIKKRKNPIHDALDSRLSVLESRRADTGQNDEKSFRAI